MIEHPCSTVFMKIFSTFDNKVLTQCQYYSGYLPVEHIIALRRLKFLNALKFSPCSIIRALYDLSGQCELERLAAFYSVSLQSLLLKSHDIITKYLENYVNSIS